MVVTAGTAAMAGIRATVADTVAIPATEDMVDIRVMEEDTVGTIYDFKSQTDIFSGGSSAQASASASSWGK